MKNNNKYNTTVWFGWPCVEVLMSGDFSIGALFAYWWHSLQRKPKFCENFDESVLKVNGKWMQLIVQVLKVLCIKRLAVGTDSGGWWCFQVGIRSKESEEGGKGAAHNRIQGWRIGGATTGLVRHFMIARFRPTVGGSMYSNTR